MTWVPSAFNKSIHHVSLCYVSPKIPKGRPCVQAIAPIWSIPCLCPWHSMTLFWPPWLVISPAVDLHKVGDPIIVIANQGGQSSMIVKCSQRTVEWNINLKGASGQEVRRSPVGQCGPSNPSNSFNETPTTTHCVFEISTNSSSVMKCKSQQSFCTWNCLCHTCSGAPHKRQKVVSLTLQSPSTAETSSPWRPCVGTQVKIWLSMPRLRHGWPEWNFRPLGRKKSHKNSEREGKKTMSGKVMHSRHVQKDEKKRVCKTYSLPAAHFRAVVSLNKNKLVAKMTAGISMQMDFFGSEFWYFRFGNMAPQAK